METKIPDEQLSLFSGFIAETMGLDFPASRWPDCGGEIAAAAGELGFDNAAVCVAWLMSGSATRNQLEILAGNLTWVKRIFSGQQQFRRSRRAHSSRADQRAPGRRTAITNLERGVLHGEEPYSIAILLHRTIPDLESWNITVMATDINPDFCKRHRRVSDRGRSEVRRPG